MNSDNLAEIESILRDTSQEAFSIGPTVDEEDSLRYFEVRFYPEIAGRTPSESQSILTMLNAFEDKGLMLRRTGVDVSHRPQLRVLQIMDSTVIFEDVNA